MMTADSLAIRPRLDEPWHRLLWLTPSALLLWAGVLICFTLVLEDTGRHPETIERLDARLIDLPAPPAPAGLQGPPDAVAPAAPEAPAPAPPQPQPRIEPKPAPVHLPREKKKKDVAPKIYDSLGAHTLSADEVDSAPSQAHAPDESGSVGSGVSGRAGTGIGSDSTGARAIYAPKPIIPDELREEIFETVAVAHFHVSYDGVAKISLSQPTSNPRLNQILLDTLKAWRFFPAVRNGVAVDSEFDIRIPITVQ